MSLSNQGDSGFNREDPEVPAIHRQEATAGRQTTGCLLATFVLLLPVLAYFGLLVVLLFDTLFFEDRLFVSLPDDVQAFLIWIYGPVAYLLGPLIS